MLSYAFLHSFFNYNTFMCDASNDYPCFEKDGGEYIYKLCPFEKVSQVKKATGKEFKLGKWSSWKLNGDWFYDQGENCRIINAPRTTDVILTCGVQNKLISVTEVTPCKYDIKFETPIACQSNVPLGKKSINELCNSNNECSSQQKLVCSSNKCKCLDNKYFIYIY